jgi:Putative esterase
MKFELSFPASIHAGPITGRMFVIITRSEKSEPRLQLFDVPFFGTDVRKLMPGVSVVVDGETPGYPLRSLGDIPAGDYYVQGLLNVYTEFHRSDGHKIWAHMDQWEGQDLTRSPGNLISEVQKMRLDPQMCCNLKLGLNKIIPPIEVPADTEWVKRSRFQSQLLSEFWGHPIYIGATILLPKGYVTHREVHYPVVYVQGHFSLDAPFGFKTDPDPPETKSWALRREESNFNGLNMAEPPIDAEFNGAQYNVESGYEFYQTWNSDDFPRVIAVTFQHPTPYFDDSYGINSANAGPYGDALLNELIPYVEEHFRVISQPYARVLTGCSTGGWGSLALQAYHPDFFGSAWIFCPDPVDFRRYYSGVNLYEDDNAFVVNTGNEWFAPERACFRGHTGQVRISNREFSRLALMIGTQDAGYAWLNYTPVGSDGFPKQVWDLATGKIDREVVAYMKAHDCDLRDYLERNWSRIGPQLAGKLHLYCGDEDGGYFNLAVYLLEDCLTNTKNPYYAGAFHYGRPLKGHGWQPMTNAELVRTMATHVAEHTPAREENSAWRYN